MKRAVYKVYDKDSVYINTLQRDLVTSIPKFSWRINSSLGEMVISLAIDLKTFVNDYEEGLIKLGNEVRIFIQDDDTNELGVRIYSGEITGYNEVLNENGKQEIEIVLIGYAKSLKDLLVKDGADTTIEYLSKDPSFIIKDLLDKYNGKVIYNNSSIDDTGTVVSYTFTFSDYLSAIDKVLQFSPFYWYYYIDAENVLHFSKPSDDTDHVLFLGKECNMMIGEKSIEPLYNAVYFVGGGDPTLYNLYEHSGSIAEYGRREFKMTDARVTVDNTAETMAEKFLDENDTPRSLVKVKVIDNSIDKERGYDIESFKVGQLVQVKHPNIATNETDWDFYWDTDAWDYEFTSSLGLPMQIIKLDYKFDHVILELSLKLEDVTKRIEDINRNVQTQETISLPSSPS